MVSEIGSTFLKTHYVRISDQGRAVPLILNLEAMDMASTVKGGQYRKGSEKAKDDSSSDKDKEPENCRR